MRCGASGCQAHRGPYRTCLMAEGWGRACVRNWRAAGCVRVAPRSAAPGVPRIRLTARRRHGCCTAPAPGSRVHPAAARAAAAAPPGTTARSGGRGAGPCVRSPASGRERSLLLPRCDLALRPATTYVRVITARFGRAAACLLTYKVFLAAIITVQVPKMRRPPPSGIQMAAHRWRARRSVTPPRSVPRARSIACCYSLSRDVCKATFWCFTVEDSCAWLASTATSHRQHGRCGAAARQTHASTLCLSVLKPPCPHQCRPMCSTHLYVTARRAQAHRGHRAGHAGRRAGGVSAPAADAAGAHHFLTCWLPYQSGSFPGCHLRLLRSSRGCKREGRLVRAKPAGICLAVARRGSWCQRGATHCCTARPAP